jgi:hypothetical protein
MKGPLYYLEYTAMVFSGSVLSVGIINSAGLPSSVEWVVTLVCAFGWMCIANRLQKIKDK